MDNIFGIKAKVPLSIIAKPGDVTLVFNRICGLQVHHEILSLEKCGNFQVGTHCDEDTFGGKPPPSHAYCVNFPRSIYDANHVATRIAERLRTEHGIESIVDRYKPDDNGDEGPSNVLVSVR